jgi:uncharacterized protein YhfF
MDDNFTAILEAQYPGEAARYFLPMSIGTSTADADEGAAAILSGTKTLTSSPFWEFADGRIPFVGALSVLLNGSRQPVAIVETTRIEVMPFSAISDELAFAYGEGERTAAWWRKFMGHWYRGSASRHGAEFREDAPKWARRQISRRPSSATPRRPKFSSTIARFRRPFALCLASIRTDSGTSPLKLRHGRLRAQGVII